MGSDTNYSTIPKYQLIIHNYITLLTAKTSSFLFKYNEWGLSGHGRKKRKKFRRGGKRM